MKILNNIISTSQFFSIAIILLGNLWLTTALHAQNVGVNNPAPHTKALMDLTSSDKGLLTPRMTQVQKNAMFPAPDATASGMLIYQTDGTEGFYYYDGVTWNYLSTDKLGWSLTGNAGTDSLLNFLGTTDNQPLVIKTANSEKIRVMVNGNTGIGTGNPIQKLHIDGNINLSNDTNNLRINNVRVFSVKGSGNLFAGERAGINNTGDRNTFIGDSSGTLNTIGSANVAVGKNALMQNTNGTWNTALGVEALENNTSGFSNSALGIGTMKNNTTGFRNTGIGGGALANNTTGAQNTALGYFSVIGNTTGNYNTGLGAYALYTNTTGSNNVAVGHTALRYSTTASNNTAIGTNAGLNVTTGANNFFGGTEAGLASTTGYDNSFIGYRSGMNNVTGFRNTALGSNSLGLSSSGEQNTAIGFNSLYNNTTGNWNAAAGAFSLYANTTGYNNAAFGNAAGMANTTGSGNTFMGEDAGRYNTTGWFNTYTGLAAGFNNTTGEYNTVSGALAGYSATTGHRNTFLGAVSGNKTTTGSWNTFVGVDAGYQNTTGNGNLFIGFEAGFSGTTVSDNTMIGINSGKFNTTGDNNTFLGAYSGTQNTTGYNNTFLGRATGIANTTGFENTFVGGYAGWKNTTGFDNAFIGRDAGLNNLTGNSNVFVGEISGVSNTTGSLNTFIGQAAGVQTTTGNNNTFIGRNAGSTNVTGNMNVALGEMAQVGSGLTNAIAIGAGSSVTTSNSIALGGTGSLAVNVGIGTSAPVSRLHVVSANTVPLSLQNTAAGGYSGLHTMNASMALTGHFGYANPGAATFADQVYAGSTTAIPFVLTTDNTEKMRIDATGNVGIGTASPTSKLHIVSNAISVPFRIQNTLNNGYSGMHLHNNTGTLMGHMGFANPASGAIGNTMYIGSVAAVPMVITTSDLERVRVDATGNVGIGTTSPTTKLEVNGFTKLGSDAPAIKYKKVTGTTSSMQGSTVTVAHGIANINKILAVEVLVDYGSGNTVHHSYTHGSGYEFNYYITPTQIYIANKSGNSASILSRPFRVLITYEE